jgi:branched-chain amino acid transport system substrate-binding protein
MRRYPDVSRKMVLCFLFVCLFSFLWYGCVTTPTINEDAAREEIPLADAVVKRYNSAFAEYKKGDLDRAIQHFQDFIIQYPRTSLTDDALYYLGDSYSQRREYKVAAIQLERLISYFPSSSYVQEGQWSLANCYYKMGEYKDALKIARQLFAAVEDRPQWRGQLLVFFGECYAALGDPLASLSWYARARREAPAAIRDGVRVKIIALLDQDMPPDTYQEIEGVYPGTFIAYYAKYRQAQGYFRKGKVKEAEGLLQEAMKEATGEDFYPRLEALWREMQVGVGVGKEIVLGCILPLKGRDQSYGARALHGIQLAIGAFRPQEGSLRIRLVIWDDEGDAARAKEGVRVLAEKERVLTIIGPLRSQTALAAAEEAEVRRIPLITLSSLPGIGQKRTYVFQNSITNALQTKILVQYAFKDLGIRTYAILYPRNTYGLTFKDLFQQEVERWGGRVVNSASYTDEQTDFGTIIRGMARYPKPQVPKGRSKAIVDFKAIFIPDDFNRLNLIVPQLAYQDIRGVQLLGNNGWNAPELVRDSDQFVEGAVFVDGFFKESPSPAVRAFVRDFEETFHSSPTLLEALSYDTTMFIIKTLGSKGFLSPDALLSFKEYNGATGLTGFTAEKEGIRNLFLLTIDKGKIRQILK